MTVESVYFLSVSHTLLRPSFEQSARAAWSDFERPSRNTTANTLESLMNIPDDDMGIPSSSYQSDCSKLHRLGLGL